MTQKRAYCIIRARKECRIKPRRSTEVTVAKVLDGIRECFGTELGAGQLWRSVKKCPELSRECKQFMWMVLHDGYMVGNRWLRDGMSDELQQRAVCQRCDEIETMEHILFECVASGRGMIWELLEETWALTKKKWSDPCWGNTLGAACATFSKSSGKRDGAAGALWVTLASESLYLIWKLRCERVIQNDGAEPSIRVVENRWFSTIDQHLDLDRRVAAMSQSKQAAKRKKVESTWQKILVEPDCSPRTGAANTGVLVGIRRVRRWDPG